MIDGPHFSQVTLIFPTLTPWDWSKEEGRAWLLSRFPNHDVVLADAFPIPAEEAAHFYDKPDPEPERRTESVRLRNGTKVIMALVQRSRTEPSLEEGYVLADTGNNLVTWRVYRWLHGPLASDTFLAESGRYFFVKDEESRSAVEATARQDFFSRVKL